VSDPYWEREQTKAKHFILKHYLEALAFKVLTFSDITYVDGFSGPWQTQTEDFADSSFMIALRVLKDAQRRMAERSISRRIRCFFSEEDPVAYARLKAAVEPFHNPAEGFEVTTYCGKFEDAVDTINAIIRQSFPLIFIDPTGWKGYPLDKLKPLFVRPKCEVVINFMYSSSTVLHTATIQTLSPRWTQFWVVRAGVTVWTPICRAEQQSKSFSARPSSQHGI